MNNPAINTRYLDFQEVVESISDYFLLLDRNLSILYCNKSVLDLTESDPEDIPNKPVFHIHPDIKNSEAEKIFLEVLATGKPQCFIHDLKIKNKTKSFEFSVYPYNDRLTIIGKDITDFKLAKGSNRHSELLIRTTLDNLMEGCAVFAPDWRYLYVNEANAIHARHTRSELLGNKLTDIFPDVEKSPIFNSYQRVMNTRVPETIINDYKFEDGSVCWFEIKVLPVPEGIFILTSDITEKKKTDEMIKASLKEKELLLKELHHRTKNNLQLISSLLKFKASSLNDKNFSATADEMNKRIHAIALVHQKLFQSNQLSRIDLAEYISDLTSLLISSYSAGPDKIHVEKHLQPVNVLVDTAVPCGLIVNELISNSLKHAFPGNRKGSLSIRLNCDNKKRIELTVADNGIGLGGDNYMDNSRFGLQLFKTIAEGQLMASISLDRTEGTEWKIRFSDTHYTERV